MECKITLQKWLKGKLCTEDDFAYCNVHTSLVDWITEHWEDAVNAVGHGIEAITTLNPEAAADAYEDAKACFSGANKSGGRRESASVEWDGGSYDSLSVVYKAWSEDSLKPATCVVISAPPEAQKYHHAVGEHHFTLAYSLDPGLLADGHYAFAFGAQDDGWYEDAAASSILDLSFVDRSRRPRGDWVVSWGFGRLDLFGLSPDGLVLHKAFDGQSWFPGVDGWNPIGDATFCRPIAITRKPNWLDVFAVGTDHHLWTKCWNGSQWKPGDGVSEWQDLGEQLQGTPAVVSWGPERLDLFGRDIVGAPVHKCWSVEAGWWPSIDGSWNRMGGAGLVVDPIAQSSGPERLDLFTHWIHDQVAHKSYDHGTWSPSVDGWNGIGLVPGSPVACVSIRPGQVNIFATGPDGQVWTKWLVNADWGPGPTDWQPMGGQVLGAPAVASWGRQRIDLFARGVDNALLHKCWRGGDDWWPSLEGDWERMGDLQVAETPTVIAWGPDRLDLFARGHDDKMLYHIWWDGQNWGPDPNLREWEFMGGPLAG